MTDELEQFLKNSGYSTKISEYEIVFSKKTKRMEYTVLYTLGLFFLCPVMIFGGYKTILLLVIYIGIPFIYRKWTYPDKIVISRKHKNILIDMSHKEIKVPFSWIGSLKVDRKVVNSHVSAFQDGYQDYMYYLTLTTSQDVKYDLIVLKARKDMSQQMRVLVNYLKTFIKKFPIQRDDEITK